MEIILSKYVLRFDEESPEINLGVLGERCIFCNKDYVDNLFNIKAHAVSEFLYNKSIYHHNECNDCNNKFNKIEREFSALVEIDRALLSMRGKGGIAQVNLSKMKSSSRITFNEKYKIPVLNNATPDEGYLSIDPSDDGIVIKNIRNSYHNTNIFKCLTKYALSIMPMELIHKYSILAEFVLQDTDHPYPYYYSVYENELPNGVIGVTPIIFIFNGYMHIKKTYFLSTMPFNGLEIKLINDENMDGLAIFSIFFGNSAFQIFIPNDDFICSIAEKNFNKEKVNISLPEFSTTEFKYNAEAVEIIDIDCSTHKKIVKEIDERHFSGVCIPLNTEKLSLDEKKELVINELEQKINLSYDLFNLWNLRLTLLWY